jgi:hypothetical protein
MIIGNQAGRRFGEIWIFLRPFVEGLVANLLQFLHELWWRQSVFCAGLVKSESGLYSGYDRSP